MPVLPSDVATFATVHLSFAAGSGLQAPKRRADKKDIEKKIGVSSFIFSKQNDAKTKCWVSEDTVKQKGTSRRDERGVEAEGAGEAGEVIGRGGVFRGGERGGEAGANI